MICFLVAHALLMSCDFIIFCQRMVESFMSCVWVYSAVCCITLMQFFKKNSTFERLLFGLCFYLSVFCLFFCFFSPSFISLSTLIFSMILPLSIRLSQPSTSLLSLLPLPLPLLFCPILNSRYHKHIGPLHGCWIFGK